MKNIKVVREQVFVTETMHEELLELADIKGISKNELIRYAIIGMLESNEIGAKSLT